MPEPIVAPTSKTVTAAFTVNGVAVDPDTVTLVRGRAGGTVEELTYNGGGALDGELVRNGVGEYETEVDCPHAGTYFARFTGEWDDPDFGKGTKTIELEWLVLAGIGSQTAGDVPTSTAEALEARIAALEANLGGPPAPLDTVGFPRVHRLDFAYDTPGLADGLPILTPEPGEVILDASFWVHEAFDGTNPLGDFGPAYGPPPGYGYLSDWVGAADLSVSAYDYSPDGYQYGHHAGRWSWSAIQYNIRYAVMDLAYRIQAGQPVDVDATSSLLFTYPQILIPPTTFPIYVFASQNGYQGGPPLDSTQGAASFYLITAKPAVITP